MSKYYSKENVLGPAHRYTAEEYKAAFGHLFTDGRASNDFEMSYSEKKGCLIYKFHDQPKEGDSAHDQNFSKFYPMNLVEQLKSRFILEDSDICLIAYSNGAVSEIEWKYPKKH